MAGTSGKRTFGELEKRKNAATGKVTGWRARYTGPDAQRHPKTFGDKVQMVAAAPACPPLGSSRQWRCGDLATRKSDRSLRQHGRLRRVHLASR